MLLPLAADEGRNVPCFRRRGRSITARGQTRDRTDGRGHPEGVPRERDPYRPSVRVFHGRGVHMRTFEFTDDKSNKFWNIELKGKTVTVVFGKIGTAGQTKPKDFSDEASAKKEHDKLVNEKVKKGYIETTKGGAPAAAAP